MTSMFKHYVTAKLYPSTGALSGKCSARMAIDFTSVQFAQKAVPFHPRMLKRTLSPKLKFSKFYIKQMLRIWLMYIRPVSHISQLKLGIFQTYNPKQALGYRVPMYPFPIVRKLHR